MTAVATVTRTDRARRGMKGLAGALALVCLALFLLAVEQRQAVAAWAAIRSGAGSSMARAAGWLADGAADARDALRDATSPAAPPLAAAAEDMVLAGTFAPADAATRDAVGGVAFAAADIRFDSGEALHTRPLRIAAGGEAFVAGQTFAARWNAPAEAQIELREVAPPDDGSALPASRLCGGAAPGAVALLHRRDRLDLMLFRAGARIGPGTSPAALCGVWSFERP